MRSSPVIEPDQSHVPREYRIHCYDRLLGHDVLLQDCDIHASFSNSDRSKPRKILRYRLYGVYGFPIGTVYPEVPDWKWIARNNVNKDRDVHWNMVGIRDEWIIARATWLCYQRCGQTGYEMEDWIRAEKDFKEYVIDRYQIAYIDDPRTMMLQELKNKSAHLRPCVPTICRLRLSG